MGELETATLGGGCFWCTEAVFAGLEGVVSVESGYSGGDVDNPSYEQVCSDTTGHAEVVQVRYDPAVVSYEDLLHVLFGVHNPTTPNRQGADVGSQYRSVIFYHDERQKETAEHVIREMTDVWEDPIVTEVSPFRAFYRAEEYHQRYFERNPHKGYCTAVISPKLSKFRAKYARMLRS